MPSQPRLANGLCSALVLPFLCLATMALSGCDRPETLESLRSRQAQGDIESTIEPLRAYLAEHPEDSEASYLYGRALVSSGQLSLATWPLRKAMRDPEWLVMAGAQLAHATLATNDFNETVEITTEILEQDPDNVTALLFRAQANAHWRRSPTSALEDVERLLEIDPRALEAYEPRILALLALERQDEARAALAEVGERLAEVGAAESTLAWHCSTSAIFAVDAGEMEQARALWLDCLERFPADPSVVSGAVQFLDSLGDWQAGLDVLEAAYAAAPAKNLFRISLASRRAALGQVEEAEALLVAATESEDPVAAARALGDLAQFHQARGDHAAAADALERAVSRVTSVETPSEQLRFQLADALVAADRLDRAFEVAAELSVSSQRRLIEARVAQERGDFQAAIEGFDAALRVWPDNPSAHYYAARAAEALGDFERALEEYRYAIRISPGATDARTRAAELLIAQGQPVPAYQLLFFEVAAAPLGPEGQVLSMYLLARTASPTQLQTALLELAKRDPRRLPEALARAAEGAADLAGPGAALQLLSGMPGMNYAHPSAAPALRRFVRFAHAAGLDATSEQLVARGLAAAPESSVFYELEGQRLRLAGASDEAARAAYARALELDPMNAAALAGMAELSREQDPSEAIRLFDAAAEADPENPDYRLSSARVVAEQGEIDEAARRLDALLVAFPLRGDAAAERVRLDLDSDRVSEATLERARRAARLQRTPEDQERLSRVQSQLAQSRPRS